MPAQYTIYRDDSGTIVARGRKEEFSGDSLPDVLDAVYAVSDFAVVRGGTYQYGRDLYLPHQCGIHFENTVNLHPDGCAGLRTGGGDSDHSGQRITGRARIRSDRGDTTAERGLYICGSKHLRVDCTLSLEQGFDTAALHIDGGDVGTWWNSYRQMAVNGRILFESTGSGGITAQVFNHDLIRGEVDWRGRNSLIMDDCWFEPIVEGAPITLESGGSSYLGGRFEDVSVSIGEGEDHVHIMADHVSGEFDINGAESTDADVIIDGAGVPEHLRKRDSPATETPQTLIDATPKGNRQAATTVLEHRYGKSGLSNILRAVASRYEGYYLLGQRRRDGDLVDDKEVEVLGDYINHRPGTGYVCTAPNGSKHRIRVDDSGNLTTEEV